MLTTTYSLVAISVEQDTARSGLDRLHRQIQCSVGGPASATALALESAVEEMARLERLCHDRKVEKLVIPAIREATSEADSLLEELDSLSVQCMNIVRNVRAGLRCAFEQGAANIDDLCCAMELYCSNLYKRLVKEEELFRIAQRVFSGEQWFAIASSLLSQPARRRSV